MEIFSKITTLKKFRSLQNNLITLNSKKSQNYKLPIIKSKVECQKKVTSSLLFTEIHDDLSL